MISDAEVEKAIDYIRDNSGAAAKAKADRLHIEVFRKSKHAILFGQSPEKTVAASDAWAYAHPDYIELLEGYKVAIEQDERLKWLMEAAKLKVEVWRTVQANQRAVSFS